MIFDTIQSPGFPFSLLWLQEFLPLNQENISSSVSSKSGFQFISKDTFFSRRQRCPLPLSFNLNPSPSPSVAFIQALRWRKFAPNQLWKFIVNWAIDKWQHILLSLISFAATHLCMSLCRCFSMKLINRTRELLPYWDWELQRTSFNIFFQGRRTHSHNMPPQNW